MLPVGLVRISWRYLLRHPWQIGLCILGVALGVAVVVSIDLANASASRAFMLSTEAIAGRATHQVVGGPGGLDEALYRRIRVDLGLREAAPVVEGYVTAPMLGAEGVTLQLLGVDPLAEAPFRPFLNAARAGGGAAGEAVVDLTGLMAEPDTVVVAAQMAERHKLKVGDELAVRVGSQERAVRIVGLVFPQDDLGRQALENVLLCDIATAQEILGSVGRLSRIDLILPDTDAQALAATAEQITALLPPGAELTRPAARSNTLRQMTQAFELNLAALSLLALIVGVFLIYNTMTFSVVQRRELLGTLRCIGVTRRQLFALVLLEAALISVVGALLGVMLGVVLGRGLVQLVTRTINDLYFVVTVRNLAIDPLVLLKGFGLGVVATLGAAAIPAREAMLTTPRAVQRRSNVEERIRRALPWTTAAGVGLLVLGLGVIVTGDSGEWGLVQGDWVARSSQVGLISAFAALFMIVIGCALLTPGITVVMMSLLRPVLGRVFGMLGRMAARDVVAALSRTSVAIAALMVAVSVTIGVGIMVGSFRQTVIAWLDQSLLADIYVAPPSNTVAYVDTTLDPAVVERILRVPGVSGRALFRNVQVQTPAGPTLLVAIDPDPQNPRVPSIKEAGAEPLGAFMAGGIFISEPLAYRTGLGVGDRLRLRTDRGEHAFPIAAIYYDYTSDRGVIQMVDATYRAFWDDVAISSVAFFVEPGVDADALVQQLRDEVGGEAALAINSNRTLRENTLVIFDRTFAITAVLQMLATLVAFIGVLSALMALQLERGRELAVLRANGLTPRELWGLVLSQTCLMGLTAGLLALPVGLVLALVLIL